jgi:ABC-type transport system involved in cytochrome c biogenesis ATPase subunit
VTTTRNVALEITGLRKRYGRKVAVDDLSLRVDEGEIFGILGRNGAGKTTTVECAEGLRRPDDGTVRVFGIDPYRDRAEARQLVGVQLQESQYLSMTLIAPAGILVVGDAGLGVPLPGQPAGFVLALILAILAGYTAASGLLAWRLFRWE